MIAASLAAATHVFPFSNSPQGSTQQGSTQQGITQSLVKLVPGGVALKPQECHSAAPSNPWTMPGLLLELRCDVPELPGNVYAYQLDNTTDYDTAWSNFNQWWGFIPARAGKCARQKAPRTGIDTWTSSDLPQASRPVQECGMQTPSPGNTVPAYAWGYRSIDAFVLAQGAPGSSFAALHSWSIGQVPKPENLLDIIPAEIKQESSCPNAGTQFGADRHDPVRRLSRAAGTIVYYLYRKPELLASGSATSST